METTYRVTVMHLPKEAPVRKVTLEGITGLKEAVSLCVSVAGMQLENAKEHGIALGLHGRTSWSNAFTEVAIEREAQAAPTEDAITWSNRCKGECKWESDPQPHNQYQSKCPACGNTMPF